MADPITRDEATWQSVRREGFFLMAPAELASRKVILFYQENSWLRVGLTLIGGLAILSTILNLSQWERDRRIQQLNLFVQIKEGADGVAVGALLKALIQRGIPPDQIPIAKANLSKANLSKIRIPKAYFKDADLKETIFREAELADAKFIDAWLNGADFTDAHLNDADFSNAKAAWIKLPKARLDGARFDVAFMFMANLEGASLRETSFWRSKLHRANLKSVDATGASFTQAILENADLTNAVLVHAVLWGTDLTGAVLKGTNLSGVWFESRDKNGVIEVDENKNPIVSKVSVEQLRTACADPADPPHLPLSDEFKGLVLPKCP
jgi:uncharacterized protein YjbI with pentapeptide repeats